MQAIRYTNTRYLLAAIKKWLSTTKKHNRYKKHSNHQIARPLATQAKVIDYTSISHPLNGRPSGIQMRNDWKAEIGLDFDDQSQILCPWPCYKRSSLDLKIVNKTKTVLEMSVKWGELRETYCGSPKSSYYCWSN